MGRTILDVGCGNRPRGTVNCDLYTGQHVVRAPLNLKQIPNFVLCDASNLPFTDNSFDMVLASHILEHLDCPIVALKEWKRVAKSKVIVAVPDFSMYKLVMDERDHIYTWTMWSLEHLMNRIFSKVTVHGNRRVLIWSRKGKLPVFVNFIFKRFLSYFPTFDKGELIAVGFCAPV